MDAADLARWTRFAAKGGIGKCAATRDCIAESADDLMFLKGDEITVLMQLPDHQDLYLGYCEGVVGRFQGLDVHFLTRLKKPVMTKRSSLSSSSQQIQVFAKTPTPTFDPNKSPSPKSVPGSPVPTRKRTLTGSGPRASIDNVTRPVTSVSVPEEKENISEKAEQTLGVGMGNVHSFLPLPSSAPPTSTVGSTPSGSTLVLEPEPIHIHSHDQKAAQYTSILAPSIPAQVPASTSVPSMIFQTPQSNLFGSPHPTTPRPSPSATTGTSAATTSVTYNSSSLPSTSTVTVTATIPPHVVDTSTTTFDTARFSLACSDSDGAVGIGLSLLQDLANGGGSSDDDADSETHSDSLAQGKEMGPRIRDSVGEVAESPSWMRSRSPSPIDESHSMYSREDEDTMRIESLDRIEGLEEDEQLQYDDDDTEQGHVDEHGHKDDGDVDQEYSDEEYEEDEDTAEGFDLNLELNLLSSSPSTSTSVSTPPITHVRHRPSPLRTPSASSSSSSASPPPSTSSQHLAFPPVAPLSPQRYRGFRQQQLQFNFPAPPTHTPVPVSSSVPYTGYSSILSSAAQSPAPTHASTSNSSTPPLSPNFPPHHPPVGLASHPTSPLSASFPFPGTSSDDGDGRDRDRDRERRPSFASHLSNTTGTGGSEWDGAGDIYDDYRYSRSSIAGTLRTMSAASMSMIAGSRRVSAGSRTTSAGSSSVKLTSGSVGPMKMNGGDVEMLPPPFVDNLEARMRVDSGPQQTKTRLTSNTTASMTTRPELVPVPVADTTDDATGPRGGIPYSDGDQDDNSAGQHHNQHIKNGSEGRSVLSGRSKMGGSTSDIDDDVSVYTQSSVGRGSMASSISKAHRPRISSRASDPNTIPSSTSARSTTTSPRPAPLSLASPNGQITSAAPSPLLHTTWGSPVSSNPTATSAKGYMDGRNGFTPLLAGGLDALTRALAAGAAALVGNKPGVDPEEESANALRPRIEAEKIPSAAPVVLTRDAIMGEGSRSSEEGLGDGNGVVAEDEDQDDEAVILPSSPVSLRSTVVVTRDSPEMVMKGRSVPLVVANRSPSPASADESVEEEGQEVDGQEKELGVFSPPVVSSIPRAEPPQVLVVPFTSAANTSSNSTLQPPPLSPSLLSLSDLPTPSSPLPSPSHLRPSLLDLRGGQPGPDQGQRRSLFLPHPNAPKAPSTHSPGPMYIAQQQPPPPQQPQAQGGAVQTIRLALAGHGTSGRRPTIYGRTHQDLAASIGPVLMTFSVDPPPATVPPPAALAPPVNVMSGRIVPSPPPPPANGQAIRVALTVDTGENSPERLAAVDQRGSGVIPRANFFPKVGGVRPRSRSFSGFNTQNAEMALPIHRSHEEGSPTLEIPSANDIRRSLTSVRPLSPSLSPSPTKTSSLRISSPLALSQHGLGGALLPKSPGSPLAQTTTFPSSPSPLTVGSRPAQLRPIISKPDLNEPSSPRSHLITRMTVSSATISSESVPTSPVVPPGQGREFTPDATSPRGRRSTDTDGASLHSTRSNVISPPPIVRQHSLRTKLSLPNLRRNVSRHDDSSSIGSASQAPEPDTMQVEDMDFELVRPNFSHLQPNRTSEELSVNGRDGLADFKYPGSLRTDSPAVSASSPRSPIVSDGSSPSSGPPRQLLPNVQSKSIESELSMDAHRQREQKWMSVLSTISPSQSKKSKKVKKLLLEGVPSSVRYLVWTHLTDGKAKCVPGVYAQLGARGRVPAFVEIERDVQRCFNDHPHLQSIHGSILSLLQAYLTMVPDVQYTTGLTLIAGQLLLLAPEEDAFWIFVSIMDTHIRPYFSSSPQIEVDSALFSRALENIDPVIAKKILIDMSISPNVICRPWFTSLFVGSLPSEHLNRVWDIFLLEGVPFLLRVGLALVLTCRRQILDATSEAAVLRHLSQPSLSLLPPTADAFITLAFSVKLKDDDVRKQRVKMEAQVKRQTQIPRLMSPSAIISLPRN